MVIYTLLTPEVWAGARQHGLPTGHALVPNSRLIWARGRDLWRLVQLVRRDTPDLLATACCVRTQVYGADVVTLAPAGWALAVNRPVVQARCLTLCAVGPAILRMRR